MLQGGVNQPTGIMTGGELFYVIQNIGATSLYWLTLFILTTLALLPALLAKVFFCLLSPSLVDQTRDPFYHTNLKVCNDEHCHATMSMVATAITRE